mgnify:FL=1
MTTDPITLAREVLETAHEDDTITVCSVPDNKAAALAHAVIDLTAKVARVEALADDMDHDADLLDQTDDLRLHLIAATHREDATRLHTALNGENRG